MSKVSKRKPPQRKTPLYDIYMSAPKSVRLRIIEDLAAIGIRYSVLSSYLRTLPAWKMKYAMAQVVLRHLPQAAPVFEKINPKQ